MSFREAPLKRAQEELTDLVSWALNLPVTRASGLAIEIHSTSHLEIEALEIALKGSMDETNKEGRRPVLSLVRSRYHFKALTGHQTLSASTEENDDMEGKKISTDWEDRDWFFAMKPGLGTRRTPAGSHLICPGSTERAWSVLILVTRSDGHKKSRLDGQSMKRSLVKRFERSFWQSSKNHREAPGRQQGLDWGTLQEEGLTQLGKDWRPWNRRSVLKTHMTRGYRRPIDTNGRDSKTLIKEKDERSRLFDLKRKNRGHKGCRYTTWKNIPSLES